MQSNRAQDTAPELGVRRAMHALGLRYRVDVRPIPALRSRADAVFPRAKDAVFPDGGFWHGCPEHRRIPTRNREYWQPKIEQNIARDRETDVELRDADWTVVRIWEHDDAVYAARRPAIVTRQSTC